MDDAASGSLSRAWIKAAATISGALGVLCLSGAWRPARPAEVFSQDGMTARWDNTVRYSLGVRVSPQDTALVAGVNVDDGDRAFNTGVIGNRVDVVSELDLARGDLGLELSADGWYDTVYHQRTANRSPGSFNPLSVSNENFTAGVRRLHGGTADLLNGFVHDRAWIFGVPVTMRVGRQTLVWGESLFFASNGIAAGQAPVDVIKALGQPMAEARELFLPVAQAWLDVPLRPGLNLDVYDQFEWRPDRLPGVGSYFSSVDFLDVGGERLFAGGGYFLRGRDRTPSAGGQYGAALHVSGARTDFGFYALRFNARSPLVFLQPGAAGPDPAKAGPVLGRYGLVYPSGIEIFGASLSTYLGNANIAGEISMRRHMPFASFLPPGRSQGYAVGDSVHAQASVVDVLPPGRWWDGASLLVEVAGNDRARVTGGSAFLAPGRDRFAVAARALFTPQYFQVAPQLDIGVPVGLGGGVFGNSSVDGGQNAGAGDVEIGVNATYRAVWQGGLQFTHYLGRPAVQPLGDRDFVSISLSRTF